MASETSGYSCQVRKKLVELQQQLATKDRRDHGRKGHRYLSCFRMHRSKVYLTASVATRAKRRYDELTEKGAGMQSGRNCQADIEGAGLSGYAPRKSLRFVKAAKDAEVRGFFRYETLIRSWMRFAGWRSEPDSAVN